MRSPRVMGPPVLSVCFFFNDTATTEIYTLSLHDALPISSTAVSTLPVPVSSALSKPPWIGLRSEEHTSELQSPNNLVCRLLLDKNKSVLRVMRRAAVQWFSSAAHVLHLLR